MEKAFGGKGDEKSEDDEKSIRKLREKVGELTIERDFFEDACKRLGLTCFPLGFLLGRLCGGKDALQSVKA